MIEKPRPAVDRLLRGISTDHVETVRDAWREMLKEGATSVSQIQGKLASSAWAENPRGPLAKYFGVLLSILDELDSSAFEKEVERLRKSKLHPMHIKTLDLLSLRTLDEPATRVAGQIPVFVASDIVDRSVVVRNIETWSNTKGLSLDNVTRIDVIARRPELDYLGLYNLFFSGIILTWPASKAGGVRLWWWCLEAEFTFYHEVGHHVSRHIEGGQVAEQEKEADEYARSMMRSSRPVSTLIGRTLLWPLRLLLERLSASSRRAGVDTT
ncbi:hypothetical protein SAMN05444004_1181 [Jannaschia faecimaris]|uniref:Uncharacterized protein n=1 Tax=Jannaschia faecimaris TaxID=1244108 RepID=A0A1H3TKA3_9RHOB|nr:hypothetical protein [Jannaschia faecimaris]SDZ50723.1 hypothetical protein SAMN05444004_1181 [Jannaschia faecimaris]